MPKSNQEDLIRSTLAEHTVTITGTDEKPVVEFTCHGDATAKCRFYPSCQCETWEDGHEHPKEPQDRCWLEDWFANDATDPCGGDFGTLVEAGYTVGMSGPIRTTFYGDYIEWAFVEKAS